MSRTFVSRIVTWGMVLWVVLLSAVVPAAARAQEKANRAITNMAEVDADFAYQGEYFGTAVCGAGGGEYVGLQVVALGDGKFDGYYLRGGLPGAGWDRATKEKISGALEGQRLICQNAQRRIVLDGETATIFAADDHIAARLERIRRLSPTLGAAPPPGALVLFDGTTPALLDGARVTPEGLLETGCTTKMPVQDFRLHLEFRTPYMPAARGQGRGNSGVYIQQRYELQILDSFGLEGVENECGGLYRQQRPEVNMCLPPLTWQTYDIQFTAARWDSAGNKIRNARITVYHNGEPIHCQREITAKTGAGQQEADSPRPIHFQHHGNPVHFRNVWIVLTDDNQVCSPTTTCRPGLLRRLAGRRMCR